VTSELGLQDQFAVLAQRLRDGRTVAEVHEIVVEAAPRLVDGCDRAAIGIARTPVRAMLAVPMFAEGRRTGALNVFADRTGAFDEGSVAQATILASFSSVAIASAGHSERAAQYEQGMATNREIGAAVGILMATHKISQAAAFDMLSGASQRLNRKLRDIAASIVRDHDGSGDTGAG
jgi:GAF domain-containing protein